MTHADGTSSTDETDRITVEYCVDGTVYRDEISMLSGTKTAQEIRVHFRNQDHPEEILGSLWIAPEEPSSIGRYGEEIWHQVKKHRQNRCFFTIRVKFFTVESLA